MKSSIFNRPHLVIMVGIPGSGRSYFAEHFAETFKAPIISYDKLQQELFLNSLHDKASVKIINGVIYYILSETLKTERTVILDGPVFSKESNDLISKIAKQFGYEPLYVWVQTDPITAKQRALKHIAGKPVMSLDQFEELVKQFNPPKLSTNIIVISGKHTYASQLKIVLKYLAEPI